MNQALDPFLELELKTILLKSEKIVAVLEGACLLDLPNWYLGAGCIAQTFWNYRSGFALDHGISDYDLVYFAPDMEEGERVAMELRARDLLGNLQVDLVNQAHVHRWYHKEFGKEISPYTSTESAIATWPTTATSIGVRMMADGSLRLYAPFGLEDLYSFTVRANKALITREVYLAKTEKWRRNWELNIIPW